MRAAQLVAVLLIGLAVSGCVTAPTVPGQPPPSESGVVAQPDVALWDMDQQALDAAFRQFAASPGTTPDPFFAPLAVTADDIQFASVPPGWKLWKKDECEVRGIQITSDGLLTCIGIDPCPEPQPSAIRGVRCLKGKGNADYYENRYIRTRQGWVQVTLNVGAFHRATLADLLAHLRKHYGEYEGVCQQVQKLAT
jgi:hypothetical protein